MNTTDVANAGQDVVIERVLGGVQDALQQVVDRTIDASFPSLEAVTLTLQTVVTEVRGGKLKVFIFSFGKTWEKEKANEMVLHLKPPKPTASAFDVDARSLDAELASAIISAAEGVKAAREGTPPLFLEEFKISLSFIVKEDGGGGADVKIEPVTLELRGDLKRKALHKIDLVFKRPANS